MKSKLIHLIAYLFIFLILNACQQKNKIYYIDTTKGNDNNSGLNINNPWKTLNKVNNYTFKAGDKIFLKRGEIWNESLMFKSSGDSLNPIIIGAYGIGADPIITRMDEYKTKWEKHSDNIWKTTCVEKYEGKWNQPWRMVKNNKEILLAKNIAEIDGKRFMWYYNKATNEIYLYSTVNPEELSIKTNLTKTTVLFSNVHNIIIRDLDLQGGYYRALGLEDSCYNIKIINCQAGKYSKMGIAGSNFYNCIIDSCSVDSHHKFNFGNSSQRGTHDGIGFWGNIYNCEIKNTVVRNWGHTNITLSSATGPVKYNKIHDCLSESPDIPYGRAFETDGSESMYNEFYNNIIRNHTVRSQVGGLYNNYHHNIIYNFKNSLVKSYGTAQAFSLQGISSEAIGNIMEYNIIANLDEEAIIFFGNWSLVKGNIFRKNIIYNVGLNPAKKENKNIALLIPKMSPLIPKDKIIDNQIFTDNYFYNTKTDKIINYRGDIMTIDEFNTKNGNYNDTIMGNIFVDPKFKDADNFNFELQENSPCWR